VTELEDRRAERQFRGFHRHHLLESVLETTNGPGVQLGDAGFVDTDLVPDLLHRRLLVVIEADHLLLAWRKRGDGSAYAIGGLRPLVRRIRLLRF